MIYSFHCSNRTVWTALQLVIIWAKFFAWFLFLGIFSDVSACRYAGWVVWRPFNCWIHVGWQCCVYCIHTNRSWNFLLACLWHSAYHRYFGGRFVSIASQSHFKMGTTIWTWQIYLSIIGWDLRNSYHLATCG